MYGLYGAAANLKNVYRLAAPFVGDRKPSVAGDLRAPFLAFLNAHQRPFVARDNADIIVRDAVHARSLIGAFAASVINDLQQEQMVGDFYGDDAREACERLLESAADEWSRLGPGAYEIFRLVVHSVLLCGSNLNAEGLRAHGGTSSKCIGLMWLTLKNGLSTQDVVEMLIHETTHSLVFIDELNHGHFDYRVLGFRENWARSSILNRPRPMDKVVHSIVVSHEILHARAHYLKNTDALSVHPSTPVLIANTLAAIDSVIAHPNRDAVCKPRALQLINDVRASLLTLAPAERLSV